jgi:hypothetical protein
MKMNSRSNSSGQVLGILVIVLALIGVGFWWLFSNKQTMAKEGREFGKEAIQRIILQHDQAFFSSRLGPQARMNFPPSATQEFFADLEKLGAPIGPVNVEGDIQFQSHFFEPTGDFHAHINYATRDADISIAISHPESRWQLDAVSFVPGKER